MRVVYAVLLPLLVLAFAPTLSYSGELFRWVDDKGVVHFTDNLHNIPEKHRAGITRIKTRNTSSRHEPTKPLFLDKASVPFLKKGQVMIVKGTINEKIPVNLVVDTGAGVTVISRATAKDLDIDLDKKIPTVPFQTANGTIHAPLVNLDSIEVGGIQLKELTAAVHDVFPDASSEGLLGLNFLRHFRMEVDEQRSVLLLERK